MMYAFIRWWATIFLRSYFRKTIIYNREIVPEKGPLILASNHPSAFMEASVLSTVMKRPIHFLVRGDMFNPRFRWLFEWTKQIPIYRQKDGISNLRKNASSFDLTYKKLGEGEAVLIFPEAKTILEKKMRPIQRGTAHLAFGAMPFIKDKDELIIQPVGVNFTDPRVPGTDVVVVFGTPFITPHAKREDREAIENFTDQLSDALSPLIIQVDNDVERNYDVMASIYYRMVYDNRHQPDALADLQKLASSVDRQSAINILIDQTDEIIKALDKSKASVAVFFPDLVVLNRMGLAMMAVLKFIWLAIGGWIWRAVRGIIYSNIKSNTFQGPTSLGVFMVVLPLVTIILLISFLILDVPLFYLLIWLFAMWLGTLIRPPLGIILKLLILNSKKKLKLKMGILDLREEIEQMTNETLAEIQGSMVKDQ